ncbi:hypothetical protein Rhe02_58920 [Rhizocola hellebori]|uniref:Sigma-70 family RNA polymerase sigma factor n=1 Tax=Rhizocola hellebori TaxID=1392758 RepID=A0A8J3VIP9_9ACTN|nr:hypothetical protein Rhe02_58920 [Rhizocola hellebori]
MLPVAARSRVQHVTEAVAEDEFEGFYAAHFGGTVAMTYGLTANMDDARDIAQEAFCRAWKQWHHVSVYDNPASWVRRVATNLAFSRWRHLRVATVHLLRQRADDTMMAPPSLDYVTVVAGLRKLPRDQRTVLVLHHMLDLPVKDIAEQLDVPVGRVKMWLLRGRRALAAEIGDALGAEMLVTVEPMDPAIQDREDAKRTRKIVTKAVAFVLALLASAIVLGTQQPRRGPQPVESSTPQPTPSHLPPPTAVKLQRQGSQINVSWNDPSDGHAQPIVVGGRQNEPSARMAVPSLGSTDVVLVSLNPSYTYCFSVILAYTADDISESEVVCIEGQSGDPRSG